MSLGFFLMLVVSYGIANLLDDISERLYVDMWKMEVHGRNQ